MRMNCLPFIRKPFQRDRRSPSPLERTASGIVSRRVPLGHNDRNHGFEGTASLGVVKFKTVGMRPHLSPLHVFERMESDRTVADRAKPDDIIGTKSPSALKVSFADSRRKCTKPGFDLGIQSLLRHCLLRHCILNEYIKQCLPRRLRQPRECRKFAGRRSRSLHTHRHTNHGDQTHSSWFASK